MLSIHKGYDVDYLTSAGGGADYYLAAAGDGKEPPGSWVGKGAEVLGLVGDVDPDEMKALYHESIAPDGSLVGRPARDYQGMRETLEDRVAAAVAAEGPYVTPERIGEIRNIEKGRLRSSVAFFDFTYSAPKSVSVAHAGYLAAAAAARRIGAENQAAAHQARADGIIDALRATARAVVSEFERNGCYTRTGHHGSGEGEWRDGAGATAAAFVQHTSREGDPQLHVHIAVLNKVQRADGADDQYRALDSRSVFRERLGIAAVADRVLARELTVQGLALVQRADGNGAEIAGVREDTMQAFSSRRTQVTDEIAQLVAQYSGKHGRAPTRRALWEMRQWAALQSRKGKHEVQRTAPEELAAWEEASTRAAVQALAEVPGAIAEAAARAAAPAPLSTEDQHRAIRIAVAEVQRQSATWTASQLKWELHRALPLLPADVAPEALVDELAAEALSGRVDGTDVVPLAPAPDVTDISALGVRASDGQSIFRAPGSARYATAGQLDMEDYLLRSAARPVRQAITPAEAGMSLAASGLGEDQHAAAVALLTSERAMQVFVGPAGTGKTHTIAAFARAWIGYTGRRVIGLTSATNAARVMASEGLAEAYNIADFLGKIKGSDETRGNLAVGPDDVLVIDEASQLSTSDLAAITIVAARYGARIILSGDTEQLTSPDAGGAMRLIAAEYGHLQLREVRRFASPWERTASLRLRDGDTGSIEVYQRHGRIREGREDEMHAGAVRLWLADFLAGRDTLLLAASNAEAASLARDARAQLIALGQVADRSDVVLEDGNDASTGDLVRARQNSSIRADGQALANRDTLRITGWQGAGPRRQALAVRQVSPGQWSRPFLLPASYLREHAELAYAGNTHVAEGRTVDTAHLVVSDGTTREGLYVGMTRGRQSNTAHVVTSAGAAPHVGGQRPAPELAPARGTEATTAEAVLGAALAHEADDLTATEVIRQAQDRATSMPHLHAIWKTITRGQSFAAVDDALRERLPAHEYQRYMADSERPVLHRQLRAAELAGQDTAAAIDEATRRPMTGARSIAAVIHGRIAGQLPARTTAAAATWTARTPAITDPRLAQPAAELASAMDHRQHELGLDAAERPPVWAVRYLGVPPPQPGALREDWVRRAGIAAGYRELAGHADPAEALGAAPEAGSPEMRESYYAAAAALEMQAEETGASSASRGDLEARVRVYERALPWAPEHVADELRATGLAEADTRAQAEIARARAEATGREQDAALAASAQQLAGQLAGRRAMLAEADEARQLWHEATAAQREQAAEASAELQRRRPGRSADAEPEQNVTPVIAPEPGPAGRDLAATVERARAAAARIEAERAAERSAQSDEADRGQAQRWRDQAEAQRTATWQPGRLSPRPAPQAADADYDLEAGQ